MKLTSDKILIISALLSGLLAFLVYIGGLQNGFVNWDDWAYVTDNAAVKTFDLKRLIFEYLVMNWHPVTMLSLALDYAVWGPEPFGYHLVNNIIHALNVFLVGVLAARLYNIALDKKTDAYTVFVGIFSALLWGLHPQHVESVAWVSERKDVLSALFFILSLLAYLKYKAGSRLFYIVSLVTFLLALLSKPMAISLPIVLLLLDMYPLRSGWQDLKRLIVEKIPFFIFSILFAFATIGAQDKALISTASIELPIRVLNALRAYAFYLYKMFVPVGLVPYYPLMPNEVPLLHWLLSLGVLVVVSLLCLFYLLKGKRAFMAVWLCYLISLFPVIGIVQVGGQAAADRYTYIPGIAVTILICGGLVYLLEKSARPKLMLVVPAVVVLVVLSILTVRQTAIWKDSVTLWSHEIAIYPIVFAYDNRAKAYFNSGDYEKAIADFNVIIESGAFDKVEIYTKRGVAFHKTGKLDLAIRDYAKALESAPENDRLYFRLGVAYFEAGEMRLSALNLSKAAQLGSAEAREFMAARNIM